MKYDRISMQIYISSDPGIYDLHHFPYKISYGSPEARNLSLIVQYLPFMKLPGIFHAMVLSAPGLPLEWTELPLPLPARGELLIRVKTCGVCRTDLHIADGELPDPKLPLIPGHEVIGIVAANGSASSRFQTGDLIGIPWLGSSCGTCSFCRSGRENLCGSASFTGYTRDGGYATYMRALEDYCFPLTSFYEDPSMAPLLCAGLIGYRSYKMIPGSAKRIGLYGFGASAHILIQIARRQGRDLYAFTREGDLISQELALELGACWAGASNRDPGVKLDASLLFAPLGSLVPKALQDLDKGGILVCAGIHMSDIPSFPYSLLWEERQIRSVANLTRRDGDEFLPLASAFQVKTTVRFYPLREANKALNDLRSGKLKGAAVLDMDLP